ncbi:MAG: diguanylate cyclase [Candidatus Eremiobacteraeota bacterium]|nr:diguanylate cyclase [Candidatus Eremiobacteraeota bacterium]
MKDERHTAESALLSVVLPLWTIAGFGDYLCHRRSRIEATSGTHESLTHTLMMAAVGVPSALALLCEINALTIAVSAGATILHEAVVIWDVGYAAGRRHVTTTEQHFHSFLEVLPLTSLLLLSASRPECVAALVSAKRDENAFALRPKRDPVARASLIGVFCAIGLFIAVPYAEELVRCFRSDRSILPHRRPPHPAE